MDIGSIFLIAAVAVLVVLFVSRPFSDRRIISSPDLIPETGLAVHKQEHQRSTLLAERDRMFTALQELDFDQSLGKVSDDDYQAQRSSLLQAGAALLKQLDEMGIQISQSDGSYEGGTPGTAASLADVEPMEDDELEQLIASRRKDRKEKSAGFCPTCGKPHGKSDSFCSFCGSGL
jgi:hypothetical protein